MVYTRTPVTYCSSHTPALPHRGEGLLYRLSEHDLNHVPTWMRMERVDPIHVLWLLDRGNVEIDHIWPLPTTHQDAHEFLVLIGVDFLMPAQTAAHR